MPFSRDLLDLATVSGDRTARVEAGDDLVEERSFR
jgi:hypothetical protein